MEARSFVFARRSGLSLESFLSLSYYEAQAMCVIARSRNKALESPIAKPTVPSVGGACSRS